MCHLWQVHGRVAVHCSPVPQYLVACQADRPFMHVWAWGKVRCFGGCVRVCVRVRTRVRACLCACVCAREYIARVCAQDLHAVISSSSFLLTVVTKGPVQRVAA